MTHKHLRLPLFIVAPEIVDLFGGEGATRSMLAEQFTTYACAVCGGVGQLDTDHPTTVLVTIHDAGTGPLGVRLAHPGCSRSGVVIVVHAPRSAGYLRVPATAWLREAGTPASVVVIAPRVRARRIAGNGDAMDLFASGLLAHGFRLLTAPDTDLPEVPGRLWVQLGPGQRIQVLDAAGNAFYDGTLPVPDAWAELAELTGLIGLVVVSGIDLEDPDRDHLTDLFAAIHDGAAVGAAVPVDRHGHPAATRHGRVPADGPAHRRHGRG